MHHPKSLSPLVTALTVVMLASDAFATDDEDAREVRRRHRPSQILFHQDTPQQRTGVEGKTWVENHLALRKGIGVVYRYRHETEDKRKLVFNVGGPVLKKKRFGLMFEVKF
jgi:hypothetical protein